MLMLLFNQPMHKKQTPTTSGFTIVELLIVVVVIAILAAITIVAYNGISQRATASGLQTELSSAAKSVENYKTLNGQYPTDLAAAGVSAKAGVTVAYEYSGSTSYCFSYEQSGQAYYISNTTGKPTLGYCHLPNGGVVTTFAGSGTAGTSDGTGTGAQFTYPRGIAVDSSGNLYIADTNSHLIRKISSSGVVTTIAGSAQGLANGTGTSTQFNQPMDIVVDNSTGNLYIVEWGNHAIRKITPAGVVTTFAGAVSLGYVDATGASARFKYPSGMTIDSAGNLYVADNGNNCIRKITPAGVVTTVAGTTTAGNADGTGTAAGFSTPMDVGVDSSGNLYVADGSNYRIRKITPSGVVTTLAGSTAGFADATGTSAQFESPDGIVVDSTGTIYVSDYNRIRKITQSGVVTTLAGSTNGYVDNTGTSAKFYVPNGLAVDTNGVLFVADTENNRIRKIQ